MKIRDTLHKYLFPKQNESIEQLTKLAAFVEKLRRDEATDYRAQISALEDERDTLLKEKRETKESEKPTQADLMKENLKLITLHLEDGQVPDYLADMTENDKMGRIGRASELWNNEMFHEIWRYLVNKQANYTLREAVNDAEIFAGRMSIYGLVLFKGEVERCNALFTEMNTKEEYDETEVI